MCNVRPCMHLLIRILPCVLMQSRYLTDVIWLLCTCLRFRLKKSCLSVPAKSLLQANPSRTTWPFFPLVHTNESALKASQQGPQPRRKRKECSSGHCEFPSGSWNRSLGIRTLRTFRLPTKRPQTVTYRHFSCSDVLLDFIVRLCLFFSFSFTSF